MPDIDVKLLPGFGANRRLKTNEFSELIWVVDDGSESGGMSSGQWSAILNRPIKFLSDFAAETSPFDAALTAIGTVTNTQLIINIPVPIAADKNVSGNVECVQQGAGIFNVTAGTLTLNSEPVCGNRRLFATSGTGRVLFGAKTVSEFKMSWWLGMDETLDATKAVADICTSLITSNGGFVKVGCWRRIAGGFIPPDHSNWFGIGKDVSGFIETSTLSAIVGIFGKLQGAGIVGLNQKDVSFHNMSFDANNLSGSFCVNFDGSYPDSAFGVLFNNCAFKNCLNGPVDITPTDGVWQIEDTVFHNCRFYNCGGSNFKIDTINSSILFSGNTYMDMKAGGGAFDIVKCGVVKVQHYTVVANSAKIAGVGPSDGSFVTRFWDACNNFEAGGGQEENVEFSVDLHGSDTACNIVFKSILFQGKIHTRSGAARHVDFENCEVPHGAFTDESGALGIFTFDGRITNRDFGNNLIASPKLTTGFLGDSYFAETRIKSPIAGNGLTTGHYNEDVLAVSLGGQTKSNLVATNFGNMTRAVRRIAARGQNSILQYGIYGGTNETDFYGKNIYRDGAGNMVEQMNYDVDEIKEFDVQFKAGNGILQKSVETSTLRRLVFHDDGTVTNVAV